MYLGFLTFKNDDTILLAASRQELLDLADQIEILLDTPEKYIAIHRMCTVSTRYPANLYASALRSPNIEDSKFWWSCSLSTVEALRRIADGGQERSFDTYQGESLMVTANSHYGREWQSVNDRADR